ncbi:uncharacterized protein LOC143470279 [Clavelina lepadiformis]|uniref:Uncharacterized protein n=1 Tax=Clavelina lepadiformis TaxID=159417 RepID=A0ABP0FUE7_CLALP
MKVLIVLVLAFLLCSLADAKKKKNGNKKKQSLKVCDPPLWNHELVDNWPLAGVLNTTQPKFELVVKRIGDDGRYIPKKQYGVVVRTRNGRGKILKMTGYYIFLDVEGNPDPNCTSLGYFKGSKLRKAGVPTVQPKCSGPLIMDRTGLRAVKRAGGGKWRAPRCGNIIMRAIVLAADGKQYHDNDSVDPQYQLLTKILRPATSD